MPPPESNREAWQDQVHQQNIDYSSAEYIPGQATILPPETLLSQRSADLTHPDDVVTTSAALHSIIVEAAKSPDDDSQIAPLKHSPYFDALLRGDNLPQEELLKDPILVAYMSDRTEQVEQSAESFRDQYPEIAAMFKEGVQAGVAQGYIPESVLNYLDSTIEQTAFQIVDQSMFPRSAGGGYDMRDKITIAHDLAPNKLRVTVVHELLHKLSGGSFVFSEEYQQFVRTRAGFMQKSADHVAQIGLTEAVDQQLALGVMTGDFATLDPDERNIEDTFTATRYYEVRKLLTAFIGQGQGLIDLKTITRAWFEDNSQAADRTEMVRQVRRAYGNGALRKVDMLFSAMNQLDPKASDYSQQGLAIINRIKPPRIRDGQVQDIGRIDIEGISQISD